MFKEASYERVLEKCQSAFPEEAESESVEYFLADSSVVKIEHH